MNKIFFVLCLYSNVYGQIPLAHHEPRHEVVLENEYIRLLKGHVPFHDTTLTHIHASNAVVVFLSSSTFGIQNIGEKAVVTKVHPGDVVYRAYGEKPVTHVVWNQDATPFDFMVADLNKRHPGNDTCSILSLPEANLQWQTKLVRAYKLGITKGKPSIIRKSNCAYLLICTAGTVNTKSLDISQSLTPSDFRFFPPQRDIEIKGINSENMQCVLLEFK